MKAHDLARQLLAGPDVDVAIALDEANDSSSEVSNVVVEDRRMGDEPEPSKVVVLYYCYGSSTYDL
jgi:hypothetical protein